MVSIAKTTKFKDEMIRTYTPFYRWNAFDKSDINDIQSVIDYARGLVIKDKEMADSQETDTSLLKSDLYIRAKENTLEPSYTQYHRQMIIDDYEEVNPYYANLKSQYGIDYYEARKAPDFKILKAINNSLDKFHKSIFEEAYYESVNYYQKVLYTHAFDNQYYHKEFFLEYIIFMTIQRYIDKEMDAYFNVDTYTKRQLKNGFISYGLDYFDSFPIEYQRRTYKLINDMIRNKGTNKVFDIIKDIFNFSNIHINKYTLGKTKDSKGIEDLVFFKTDINDTLNINTDPKMDYDEVTGNDPYWRTPKEDVFDKDFNTLSSKYISVDVLLDILVNSRQMSYFYNLINDIQIEQEKAIKEYMHEHNVTYDVAKKEGGFQDTDFYFSDRNISDKPIHIFDAIIALIELILVRMRWSDKIHHKNGWLRHVHKFNLGIDNKDKLMEARKYLLWNEDNKFSSSEYEELNKFYHDFYIQGIDKDSEKNTYSYVSQKFSDHSIYASQLIAYSRVVLEGELIGSKLLEDHIKKNELYDGLEYLHNLIMDVDRGVKIGTLYPYDYIKDIFSDYIDFSMNNGNIKTDDLLSWSIGRGKYIYDELVDFIKLTDDTKLNELFRIYNEDDKSNENLLRVYAELPTAIERSVKDNTYTQSRYIQNFPNLSVFLDVYLKFLHNGLSLINLEQFTRVYRFNQKLETKTEDLIINIQDPFIWQNLKELWNDNFVGDQSMELFMGYKTYSDYLKDKDPNLYQYTRIYKDYNNIDNFDFEGTVRDKIFELATDIDNHLDLGDYDFFLTSNFIGLEEYVKDYIYILIQIFKAYTVDTIYAHTVYNLNDKWENSFKVLDGFEVTNRIKLKLKDHFSIVDTMNTDSHMKPDGKDNTITLTESLVFKRDGKVVDKKVEYGTNNRSYIPYETEFDIFALNNYTQELNYKYMPSAK